MNYTLPNNLTIPQEEHYIIVRQIGLSDAITYLLFYILIHWFIGRIKINREQIVNPTEEQKEELKKIILLFKWFPAIYIVMIVLSMGI